MKKALLMGGATLLAFALIFSACDNGTIKVEEDIPSLSGPEILSVVNDHEGVITVTWNPEVNAAGYEIWRKAKEDGAAVVQLGTVEPSSDPLAPKGITGLMTSSPLPIP
ncbi:hypothetical protein Holit_00245 [Hollandina sp. SP2]